MKTLRKLSVIALFVAALSVVGLFPADVQAQATGDSYVKVKIPPVLILFYFSELEVELSATDLGAERAEDSGSTTVSISGWSGDANISTTPTSTAPSNTSGTVTVQKAWGYWVAGGNRTVQAALTAGAADALTLENGTGTITMSALQIQAASSGWGTTISFSKSGAATSGTGDLKFDVDLSSATVEGTYEDAGNGAQFTISLTYL